MRMGTPPMIVAIPDGWSLWGCGQWVDSPVTGNFEQYVIHDVVESVDATYRTIPSPRSRGVFGFSSGGFGARNLASRNPDTFGAMAVLSADSFLDMTHKYMPYKYLDSIWPEAPNGPVEGNFWSEIVYDYAACYSPNPDKPPFYVDLPVAFPSGELIQEVWDRWLSFDPVVNVHDRLDNLRKLSGILLDVVPRTTTTCTGVIGCSATIFTRPGSLTRPARTLATTEVGGPSATRWHYNCCRKFWMPSDPDVAAPEAPLSPVWLGNIKRFRLLTTSGCTICRKT